MYFDKIDLDRKSLAWLAFGAISGGWLAPWRGLDGRACVWACLAMCHCVTVSVCQCVTVWPPAYLAGGRSSVSATVSVCYDFERGRMAEKWQKMSTTWANVEQIAREPEVNNIVK